MGRTTKVLVAFGICLAFCFALLEPVYSANEAKQNLVYLTFAPGSELYTIAVAQAQVLSRATNLDVSVQPTPGSGAMPGLLASGQGHLADSATYAVWEFYNGLGVDKPYPMLRVLQGGHDAMFALITRENSGIKTIADLRGRRVTGFYPALRMSNNLVATELEAYGLDPNKDVIMLKAENSTKGLSDLAEGRTDAAMASVMGAKIQELSSKTKFRVLPFEAGKMLFLSSKMPGMYLAETLPGMAGVDPGIPVVNSPGVLFTTTELSDETAYRIVKTLLDKHSEMAPIAFQLQQFSSDRAVIKAPVPYHPGAIRYYKERGLWSGEMDKLQADLLQKTK
jgi:uncharacterized protein